MTASGAGRGHQGQDVFAKCGTKIVAARGGKVQTNAYQSAAGYYVVIDGKKTGKDYVYMHMEKKGRPKEGSRVRTGEMIGRESDTGDAQRLPPPLRALVSPRLVRGRTRPQPDQAPEEVGQVVARQLRLPAGA